MSRMHVALLERTVLATNIFCESIQKIYLFIKKHVILIPPFFNMVYAEYNCTYVFLALVFLEESFSLAFNSSSAHTF